MPRMIKIKRVTPEAVKEKLFQDHLPLAKKLAKDAALRYRLSFHAVAEEAERILGLCITHWDGPEWSRMFNPKKCSVMSWIYRRIYWDLKTWCTRRQSREVSFTAMGDDPQVSWMPGKESFIDDLLRTLSEDAKLVVSTILHAPTEIIDDISDGAPTRSRKAVKMFLRDRAWEEERINRAWSEVEACL